MSTKASIRQITTVASATAASSRSKAASPYEKFENSPQFATKTITDKKKKKKKKAKKSRKEHTKGASSSSNKKKKKKTKKARKEQTSGASSSSEKSFKKDKKSLKEKTQKTVHFSHLVRCRPYIRRSQYTQDEFYDAFHQPRDLARMMHDMLLSLQISHGRLLALKLKPVLEYLEDPRYENVDDANFGAGVGSDGEESPEEDEMDDAIPKTAPFVVRGKEEADEGTEEKGEACRRVVCNNSNTSSSSHRRCRLSRRDADNSRRSSSRSSSSSSLCCSSRWRQARNETRWPLELDLYDDDDDGHKLPLNKQLRQQEPRSSSKPTSTSSSSSWSSSSSSVKSKAWIEENASRWYLDYDDDDFKQASK